MQYKIVFSDIDGTVLDNNHRVLPSTIKAVQNLCDKNIPFVLVSARMPKAMYTIANEMQVNIPLISYGGALILDKDKNILYDNRLSVDTTKKIIAEIKDCWKNSVVINYYAGDEWYAEDINNTSVIREEKITSVNSKQEKFTDLLQKRILPNKLLCMTEPFICEKMEKILCKSYPDLKVVRSSPILLEIMNKEISKSEGIKILLKNFNLNVKDAIAFGDNYNDVDMLELVGLGVAMKNAPQDVQERAKYITDSNDTDGIYKCLKKLQIIE